MPNLYGVPEKSPQEVAEMLSSGSETVILDVREDNEIAAVALDHPAVIIVPLSLIARERKNAFPAALQDPHKEMVVMCHHGIRSAQVVAWMHSEGWTHIYNLAGGIDAWAQQVDPSIGTY